MSATFGRKAAFRSRHCPMQYSEWVGRQNVRGAYLTDEIRQGGAIMVCKALGRYGGAQQNLTADGSRVI